MRKLKRMMQSLITVAAVFAILCIPVSAAEPYPYTVTFYAGNQGSFSSLSGLSIVSQGSASVKNTGDRIIISGLLEGDTVSFDSRQAVELKDGGRYYIQGVRLSARDNDFASLAVPAFSVTEDVDYVVAYGIQGDQVAYTVNYEDEAGNTLAPSQTFYGNVGDKPVVAYQYIENYVPEALALTKTLSANEAENVFTFVYRDATEVIYEPGETITITTVIPGTNTVQTIQVPAQEAGMPGGTGTGGIGTDGAGTAGGTAAAGAGGTAGTTDGGVGITAGGAGTDGTDTTDAETITEDETSQGVVDLDEGETPKGDGSDVADDSKGQKKGLSVAASVGIGAAGVAALCVILALIRKLRK